MSLVDYDILKDLLISMNIEERFINKMIEKSNSFVNELRNNSISYTFPLYTSFKKIDEMFSVGGVPEKLMERIKPVAINIELSKTFIVISLEMVYRYFENIYIVDLDYHEKSGSVIKIDKLNQKNSINAKYSLDKLYENFGINKDIYEMIKRNQFINGRYGYFNITSYENIFKIKSERPTEACNVPSEVVRILGKNPVYSSFDFSNNYMCNNILFMVACIERVNQDITLTEKFINMDINGKLISYIEKITDKTSNIFKIFLEVKIADLSFEEIETFIRIYKNPVECKTIVPEFFVEGPSNIPNFNERFNLAQMIVC